MKRIHYSRMLDIIKRTDSSGRYKPFSFTYVKKNGQLRTYKGAVFSSIHSSGNTVNILPAEEIRPKKFLRILILEINNTRVYL